MSWIIQKIRSRLYDQNKNWICVICGATGTGKSYSALRLAQMIDPTFTIDRCCFSAEEFLKLLNSGTLRTGNVIILDEAGVGLPARQWYDICNKSINYVLQTFRRENIALIMTTPALSFIDIQARILSHCYIDTQKIDREKKRVLVKIKEVQFNPQMGKIYYKYYRKGKQVLNHTSIEKPSLEMIKSYEAKKKQFSKSLYVQAMENVREMTPKPKMSIEKIVEEILKNPKPYLRTVKHKAVVRLQPITLDYGVGDSIASRIKYTLEKNYKKELDEALEISPSIP